MKLNYGLKNGAVLQRDKNDLCKCYFSADIKGEIKVSYGKITKFDENVFILTDIPVGGPYEIIISDDEGSSTLSNIYVGDLWLLGGQSNMEGAGKLSEKQKIYDADPDQTVRAYYMREEWDAAKSQLHQPWESADECISAHYRNARDFRWGTPFPEHQDNGVGSGLYFALDMKERFGGVPQGVIPCGVGGASLADWSPDGKDNFYTSAVRRAKECGGNIRGVFWYQGESQANSGSCESFVSDMQYLISSMRDDFGDAELPVVQVQINKYTAASEQVNAEWRKIREIQRTLCQHIDRLETVSTMDCELDDFIHISSESHEKLGKRAAEAMYRLLTGEGISTPDIDFFEIVEDDYTPFLVNLRIHYKNVIGELTSRDFPWGFTIVSTETGESRCAISRVCLEGDYVRIKVEVNADTLCNSYVCYGYSNEFYCNITDSAGRALLGFGPLRIGDHLKKEF